VEKKISVKRREVVHNRIQSDFTQEYSTTPRFESHDSNAEFANGKHNAAEPRYKT